MTRRLTSCSSAMPSLWNTEPMYRQLDHPLRTVGALLDAKWVHPNRSDARSTGRAVGRVGWFAGFAAVLLSVPIGVAKRRDA